MGIFLASMFDFGMLCILKAVSRVDASYSVLICSVFIEVGE